jgi:hypothetical protein
MALHLLPPGGILLIGRTGLKRLDNIGIVVSRTSLRESPFAKWRSEGTSPRYQNEAPDVASRRYVASCFLERRIRLHANQTSSTAKITNNAMTCGT